MLLFGEDGVVGFKPVFLEHCFISGGIYRESIGLSPEEGACPRFQCVLTLDLGYLALNLAFQLLNSVSTATYLAVGFLGTTEHILDLVP